MSVNELIAHLQQFDDSLPVYLTYDGLLLHCCSDCISLQESLGKFPRGVLFDVESGKRIYA